MNVGSRFMSPEENCNCRGTAWRNREVSSWGEGKLREVLSKKLLTLASLRGHGGSGSRGRVRREIPGPLREARFSKWALRGGGVSRRGQCRRVRYWVVPLCTLLLLHVPPHGRRGKSVCFCNFGDETLLILIEVMSMALSKFLLYNYLLHLSLHVPFTIIFYIYHYTFPLQLSFTFITTRSLYNHLLHLSLHVPFPIMVRLLSLGHLNKLILKIVKFGNFTVLYMLM
jgi:hypothetical protein